MNANTPGPKTSNSIAWLILIVTPLLSALFSGIASWQVNTAQSARAEQFAMEIDRARANESRRQYQFMLFQRVPKVLLDLQDHVFHVHSARMQDKHVLNPASHLNPEMGIEAMQDQSERSQKVLRDAKRAVDESGLLMLELLWWCGPRSALRYQEYSNCLVGVLTDVVGADLDSLLTLQDISNRLGECRKHLEPLMASIMLEMDAMDSIPIFKKLTEQDPSGARTREFRTRMEEMAGPDPVKTSLTPQNPGAQDGEGAGSNQ